MGRGQEPSTAQIKLSFIHIPQDTRGQGMRGAQPLWAGRGHTQPQGTHTTPPTPTRAIQQCPPMPTDPLPQSPTCPPAATVTSWGSPAQHGEGFGGGSAVLDPSVPNWEGVPPPWGDGGGHGGSGGEKQTSEGNQGGRRLWPGGAGGNTWHRAGPWGARGVFHNPPPAALVHFEEVGVGLQEVEAVIHQETRGARKGLRGRLRDTAPPWLAVLGGIWGAPNPALNTAMPGLMGSSRGVPPAPLPPAP